MNAILDYRRQSTVPSPLYINGDCVEKVHTFKFLGANLSDDLMVCQHLRDSKKGTAATTLPESTQEKQPGV